MQNPLDISQDISKAINHNEAVVALESSVIAHGLPSPINVETALAMEEAVRSAGAVPATIGVIEGKARIGLTKEEIERLGKGGAPKLATRDLAYAVHKKLDGGTTVSSTARLALASNIAIMATGGIGGVHRNFSQTFDVSADLWELARTPIIIVCSGIKSVLDIAATMEWLETHGIPVYGFGTDELPSFYSSKSGMAIPKLDDAHDVAELAKLGGGALGIRGSMIIAAPVPKEAEVDVADEIAAAVKDADEQVIRGKELTPFLLNRVAELTNGKSIQANVALLKNNAKVAAQIASAMLEDDSRRVGFLTC